MKRVSQICAQGDVLLRRIKTLPKNAVPAIGLVIAHSETGHHHTARAREGFECERFTDPRNALVSYLRVRAVGDEIKGRADAALAAIDAVLIEHQRSFDTHETIALACEGEEAVYQVIRQRELAPEGWRAVVD